MGRHSAGKNGGQTAGGADLVQAAPSDRPGDHRPEIVQARLRDEAVEDAQGVGNAR